MTNLFLSLGKQNKDEYFTLLLLLLQLTATQHNNISQHDPIWSGRSGYSVQNTVVQQFPAVWLADCCSAISSLRVILSLAYIAYVKVVDISTTLAYVQKTTRVKHAANLQHYLCF
jgi:hypothetical protein